MPAFADVGPRSEPANAVSETEIGEVAVANGDAAARGQKAVDRGHQAAEQGVLVDGRWIEAVLDMDVPFSEVAKQLRFAISREV